MNTEFQCVNYCARVFPERWEDKEDTQAQGGQLMALCIEAIPS